MAQQMQRKAYGKKKNQLTIYHNVEHFHPQEFKGQNNISWDIKSI